MRVRDVGSRHDGILGFSCFWVWRLVGLKWVEAEMAMGYMEMVCKKDAKAEMRLEWIEFLVSKEN